MAAVVALADSLRDRQLSREAQFTQLLLALAVRLELIPQTVGLAEHHLFPPV